MYSQTNLNFVSRVGLTRVAQFKLHNLNVRSQKLLHLERLFRFIERIRKSVTVNRIGLLNIFCLSLVSVITLQPDLCAILKNCQLHKIDTSTRFQSLVFILPSYFTTKLLNAQILIVKQSRQITRLLSVSFYRILPQGFDWDMSLQYETSKVPCNGTEQRTMWVGSKILTKSSRMRLYSKYSNVNNFESSFLFCL